MNLPHELDPLKACRAEQILAGQLAPTELVRITGLTKNVHYHLCCKLDNKQEPELLLSLQAELVLTCHRCNQAMQYILNEEIQLDEPEIFNPLTTIEDELILALPMIPMHAEKDCTLSQNTAYSPVENDNNTYKPFAHLGEKLDLKE